MRQQAPGTPWFGEDEEWTPAFIRFGTRSGEAQRLVCRTCGAPPSHLCLSKSGRLAVPHAARFQDLDDGEDLEDPTPGSGWS